MTEGAEGNLQSQHWSDQWLLRSSAPIPFRCFSDPLGSCRRIQTVLHTPATLRTSQSHRTTPSPRDSCPSVPFAGVVEKRISPRLGCPPRSKNASHLLTDKSWGSNRMSNRSTGRTGKRGREPTSGLSITGCLEVPGQV